MLSESEVTATVARITYTGNPSLAAEEAGLLCESLPEQAKLKGQVLGQFNALCPERTLFTTNSSSLVPSQFAAATGRPDRFCALHFHQPVWYANVVDIMPHPGTAAETVNLLHDFARRIDLAYEITTQKTKWVSFFPKAKRVVNLLKEKVDQGHLGQKSGSGFYHYPDPVFAQPDFLTGPAPAAGTATAPDTD